MKRWRWRSSIRSETRSALIHPAQPPNSSLDYQRRAERHERRPRGQARCHHHGAAATAQTLAALVFRTKHLKWLVAKLY
jgi:hypothetical protein